MAKRAYYATQTVVADLINDEACYPDKTSATADSGSKRVGFDDGYGYPNCTLWGGSENTGTIETEGANSTKFMTLFEDKLGVLPNDYKPKDTFSTSADGMEWVFSSVSFDKAANDGGTAKLTVDVNGSDKPNCGSGVNYATEFGSGGSDCATRTTGFDRFQMKIYGNGKMEIVDTWAQDAVRINKDITEDK